MKLLLQDIKEYMTCDISRVYEGWKKVIPKEKTPRYEIKCVFSHHSSRRAHCIGIYQDGVVPGVRVWGVGVMLSSWGGAFELQ